MVHIDLIQNNCALNPQKLGHKWSREIIVKEKKQQNIKSQISTFMSNQDDGKSKQWIII
jgi:hypothetical protein